MLMVGAAFFFSLMTVFVKLIGTSIPTAEVILVRSIFAAGVTVLFLIKAGEPILGKGKPLLLMRGVVGFAALLCFFYAIPRLPLADVTVLQYSNPIFVAVFASIALGEKLGRREIGCIALGIIGVILITRPTALLGQAGGGPALDRLATAAALTGAVLSAVAYVLVRKLTATEHPLVVVLYFPLLCIPLSMPFLLDRFVWPDAEQWLYLIGIGITAQIAQVLMTLAYRAESAASVSGASYAQMIFAAAWGLVLFAEVPTLWLITGSVLIASGILLLSIPRTALEPLGR